MNVYAYNAALYCEDCGKLIVAELRAKGVEDTGDTGDFPQGPYGNGGGESDCPNHCDCMDECVNSPDEKTGVFLENPLTSDGVEYVREAVANGGEVAQMWADFYEIEA